jgi:hypothetical protein
LGRLFRNGALPSGDWALLEFFIEAKLDRLLRKLDAVDKGPAPQ